MVAFFACSSEIEVGRPVVWVDGYGEFYGGAVIHVVECGEDLTASFMISTLHEFPHTRLGVRGDGMHVEVYNGETSFSDEIGYQCGTLGVG